jgi:hypothetical protein
MSKASIQRTAIAAIYALMLGLAAMLILADAKPAGAVPPSPS